jgi:hypothetical protein
MTPDQLFTDVTMRMGGGWAEVWTFREVSEAGLATAHSEVVRKKHKGVRGIIYGLGRGWNDEYTQLFGTPEGLAAREAEWSLASTRASVDAASLVFAHSVVDASATGFLRVASMIAPEDWQEFLDNKKWSVAEVREQGYDKLFRGLVFDEMVQIERNLSLPKKGQRLKQLCRPDRNIEGYEEAQLERVDRLRHDIIHGAALGQEISTIDADLELLERLGWYFFQIVHQRYPVRLLDKA